MRVSWSIGGGVVVVVVGGVVAVLAAVEPLLGVTAGVVEPEALRSTVPFPP